MWVQVWKKQKKQHNSKGLKHVQVLLCSPPHSVSLHTSPVLGAWHSLSSALSISLSLFLTHTSTRTRRLTGTELWMKRVTLWWYICHIYTSLKGSAVFMPPRVHILSLDIYREAQDGPAALMSHCRWHWIHTLRSPADNTASTPGAGNRAVHKNNSHPASTLRFRRTPAVGQSADKHRQAQRTIGNTPPQSHDTWDGTRAHGRSCVEFCDVDTHTHTHTWVPTN